MLKHDDAHEEHDRKVKTQAGRRAEPPFETPHLTPIRHMSMATSFRALLVLLLLLSVCCTTLALAESPTGVLSMAHRDHFGLELALIELRA